MEQFPSLADLGQLGFACRDARRRQKDNVTVKTSLAELLLALGERERARADAGKADARQAAPSIEELHAIGIDITGGEDSADYVARLRGQLDDED